MARNPNAEPRHWHARVKGPLDAPSLCWRVRHRDASLSCSRAGIEPDYLRPASIDETPKKGEVPRTLVRRLARAKAEAAYALAQKDQALRGAYILAADTTVAVGRKIVSKTDRLDEAAAALQLLSGRSHRVYTSVCLVLPTGQMGVRVVETRVRMKRLSNDEIESYLGSGEWRGKAGAYAIQGIAGAFVRKLVGSYTNVVGLPADGGSEHASG